MPGLTPAVIHSIVSLLTALMRRYFLLTRPFLLRGNDIRNPHEGTTDIVQSSNRFAQPDTTWSSLNCRRSEGRLPQVLGRLCGHSQHQFPLADTVVVLRLVPEDRLQSVGVYSAALLHTFGAVSYP